ncbi:MAG: sarcosine oxidase subunit gamma [Paracoccaceae bacterium]|jgi:sarcosine oxidase subunit gamma
MSDALKVTRAAPCAMISLKCDLSDPAAVAACAALGLGLPGLRRIAVAGDVAVAWMASDELLFIAPDMAAAMAAIKGAMDGCPHLVVDLSDARARFRVDGPGAREVIAKGAPADLRRTVFAAVQDGEGDFRRTRLGQIAAAFWAPADDAMELICFRSVADHAEAWLRQAARKGSLPGVL